MRMIWISSESWNRSSYIQEFVIFYINFGHASSPPCHSFPWTYSSLISLAKLLVAFPKPKALQIGFTMHNTCKAPQISLCTCKGRDPCSTALSDQIEPSLLISELTQDALYRLLPLGVQTVNYRPRRKPRTTDKDLLNHAMHLWEQWLGYIC